VTAPIAGRPTEGGPPRPGNGWARQARAATPLLGAVGLLTLAVACWQLGRAALPAPPVGAPNGLGAWVDELGPAGAAMALARLAVTGVAAWLGTAMSAHLALSTLAPAGPVRTLATRLVPATARHLVSVLAGAGLGGAAVVTVATPALAGDPPATATLRALPAPSPGDDGPVAVLRSLDAPASTTTTFGAGEGRPGAPGLPGGGADHGRSPGHGAERRLAGASDPGAGGRLEFDEGTAPVDRTGADDATSADLPAPAASLEVWSVEPGESFWSIAVEVLADRWGRIPTDGEVGPYWRALVEANADRLVTGDPDLLYAGQVLVLPAP
jgi:nucleoid-associated protein YgaU